MEATAVTAGEDVAVWTLALDAMGDRDDPTRTDAVVLSLHAEVAHSVRVDMWDAMRAVSERLRRDDPAEHASLMAEVDRVMALPFGGEAEQTDDPLTEMVVRGLVLDELRKWDDDERISGEPGMELRLAAWAALHVAARAVADADPASHRRLKGLALAHLSRLALSCVGTAPSGRAPQSAIARLRRTLVLGFGVRRGGGPPRR